MGIYGSRTYAIFMIEHFMLHNIILTSDLIIYEIISNRELNALFNKSNIKLVYSNKGELR